MSPLLALLIGNAMLVFGTGLQAVLLPLRAGTDGFSLHAVGLLGTAASAGSVAGCLLVPALVRRVGHKGAFVVLAALVAQTFPLHALSVSVPLWLALRVLAGFCFVGLSMIIESWVNEMSANSHRGRTMAVYLVLTALALASGQALVCLTGTGGGVPFAVAGAAIGLSLLPLAFSIAPVPKPLSKARPELGRLWRTAPVALLGSALIGAANGAFWSLAPAFARTAGQDAGAAALFVMAAVLGGAAAQYPVGRWSDRCDRRLPILLAAAIAAALSVALGAVAASWPALLAASALYGAAAFQLYGLLVAHANDHAGPGAFLATSSGLLLVTGAGAMAGPLLATAAMAAAGPGGLFLANGALFALLGLFTLARLGRGGVRARTAGQPDPARLPLLVRRRRAGSSLRPAAHDAAAAMPRVFAATRRPRRSVTG